MNGYAKIERGESDISIGCLDKIAQVLGLDVQKLLNFSEANVFYLSENCNYNGSIVLSEAQCAHELEKCRLLLQAKQQEIDYLKNENALLKEMLAVLKKQQVDMNGATSAGLFHLQWCGRGGGRNPDAPSRSRTEFLRSAESSVAFLLRVFQSR